MLRLDHADGFFLIAMHCTLNNQLYIQNNGFQIAFIGRCHSDACYCVRVEAPVSVPHSDGAPAVCFFAGMARREEGC